MSNNNDTRSDDSNSIMIRLEQIKRGGKVTITRENISVFFEFKDNTSSFAQVTTVYKREITYDELLSLNSAIDLLSDKSLDIFTEYQKCFSAANKLQQNIRELYRFGKTFVYENYNFFDLIGKDQHINASLENLISKFSNYLEKDQIGKLKYPQFLTTYNLLYFGSLLQRKENKKILQIIQKMFQIHNAENKLQEMIINIIKSVQKDEFIYDPVKCSIRMFSLIYTDLAFHIKYPSIKGHFNNEELGNHFTKFQNNLQLYFNSQNFLIIKVDKTVETFHVLPILSALLYNDINRSPFFFENFFCFEDSDIESYLEDLEGQIKTQFCFIVHPELLSSQSKNILKEKILSRMTPIPDLTLQKLVVITASDDFTFKQTPKEVFTKEVDFEHDETCIKVDTQIMKKYSTISQTYFDFQVIQSSKPGSGKSIFINQEIDKIAKKGKSRISHHFIVDADQPIPIDSFKNYGEDIHNIIHFQFNDEIMKNGIKFWSHLHQLFFYGFVMPKNSEPFIIVNHQQNQIFFEIPQFQKTKTTEYPLDDMSQFPLPIPFSKDEDEFYEETKLENRTQQKFEINDNHSKLYNIGIKSVLRYAKIGENLNINLNEYMSLMFKKIFNVKKAFKVSLRKLGYIEKYLYKYTKLYINSSENIKEKIDSKELASFFYCLTVSAFYEYDCLPKNCRKGITFLTVDNLFDDHAKISEKKIHFYTTTDKKSFYIFDPEITATKNDSFSIEFNFSINDKTKTPQEILRNIFCTNAQYAKNVEDFKLKHPDSYISLTQMTIPTVFRSSIILNRIFLSQPIILSGDTGCGKTSSLMLLYEYFKIPINKQMYSLSVEVGSTLNCHGGVTIEDVVNHLKKAPKSSKKHIVFFDELNTSPASSFIEHLLLNEKESEIYHSKFVFIGALNPWKYKNPISYNLTKVGLPQLIRNEDKQLNLIENNESQAKSQNMSEMMYHVHRPQQATDDIIFDFNPICFEENKNDKDILYPKEEQDSIHSIIDLTARYPEDDGKEREQILGFFKKSIDTCITFIRHLMNERAVISYRDIRRAVEIYKFLYQYILDNKEKVSNISGEDVALVTIIVSFVLRLPNHQKVSETDLKSSNDQFKTVFEEYFKSKKGKYEYGNYDKKTYTLDIREKLISMLTTGKETVDDLKKRFMRFVYNYTFKYIKDPKIWKFRSTFIHLFIMDVCIRCTLPCFVIGMPGTSKSYAVELLQNRNKDKLYISTYMSSRTSSPDGIKSQYYDAIYKEIENKIKHNNEDCFYVVFIDEMGNANINPSRPLKFLHGILDHGLILNEYGYSKVVATIGVSNYTMDFANMNRGVLVYTDLPDFNEIIRVFQYDEENPNISNADKFIQKMDAIDKLKGSKIKDIFLNLWPEKEKGKPSMPETIALRSVYNTRFLIDSNTFNYHDVCSILRELFNSKRLGKKEGLYEDLRFHCPKNVIKCYKDNTIKFNKINNFFCFYERIADKTTKSNKSLSIFTQNYEVLEYINLFYDDKFIEYLNEQFDSSNKFSSSGFSYFKYFLFAENFKDKPSDISQSALEKITECIKTENQNIIFVGNHPCFDSCLDLLNVPHSKENSTIKSREVTLGSGFSSKFVLTNLKFYIVMIANISDFLDNDKQNNPFSYAFLDRTETLYLDWKMISEYYLPHKLPARVRGRNMTNKVLSKEERRKKTVEIAYKEIQDALEDHVTYESKGAEYLHSDIQDLYEKYQEADFGDECLNELVSERWKNGIRAVILTKSKILEDLYYPSKFNNQRSRLIINDTNLQNIEELHKLILKKQGKEILIIIRCSEFDNLHFAHLKSFFDRKLPNDHVYHVFIVYFGCDPEFFKELSTFRWPILSMEDISKHPELEYHMSVIQTKQLKDALNKMDTDLQIEQKDTIINNKPKEKTKKENKKVGDENEEEEEEFELEPEPDDKNTYSGVCDMLFRKLFDIIVKFTEKDIQEKTNDRTLSIKKDYDKSEFKNYDYFQIVKKKIPSFNIDEKKLLQSSLKSQIISSVFQRLNKEIGPFLLFTFGSKMIKVHDNSVLIVLFMKIDLQLPFQSYLNHGTLNFDVFHYLFSNYIEFLIRNQVSFDKDMIQRKYIADRVISLLNKSCSDSSDNNNKDNNNIKVIDIFSVISRNLNLSKTIIDYYNKFTEKMLKDEKEKKSFQFITDALRFRSFAGLNVLDYFDIENYWNCYFTSSLYPNDESDKINSEKSVLNFRNKSIFEIFKSPIEKEIKSKLKELHVYADICKHMNSFCDNDNEDKIYRVFRDFNADTKSLKDEKRLEFIKEKLNDKSISNKNRKMIASMLCFYILNKWNSSRPDDIGIDIGHIPAIHHKDYTFFDTTIQTIREDINDRIISKFADVYDEQYSDLSWDFREELNGRCFIDAIQSIISQSSTVNPKLRKFLHSGIEKGEPLAVIALRRFLKYQSDEAKEDLARIIDPFFADQRLADYFIKSAKGQISKIEESEIFPFNEIAHDDKFLACITYNTIFKLRTENIIYSMECVNPSVAQFIWFHVAFSDPKRYPLVTLLIKESSFFIDFHAVPKIINAVLHLRHLFSYNPALIPIVLHCTTLFKNGKLRFLFDLDCFDIKHERIKVFDAIEQELDTLKKVLETEYADSFAEVVDKTSYDQINFILPIYFKRYNSITTKISKRVRKSPFEVKSYSIVPNMLITNFTLTDIICPLIYDVEGLYNYKEIEKNLTLLFTANIYHLPEEMAVGSENTTSFPLIKVNLSDSEGKDFLGFTKSDYKYLYQNVQIISNPQRSLSFKLKGIKGNEVEDMISYDPEKVLENEDEYIKKVHLNTYDTDNFYIKTILGPDSNEKFFQIFLQSAPDFYLKEIEDIKNN